MPDGFDEEAYGELRPLIEKILEEGRSEYFNRSFKLDLSRNLSVSPSKQSM